LVSQVTGWGHTKSGSSILAKALAVLAIVLIAASPILWSLGNVYAIPTAATLTEWTIPTPNSTPTGLALDPSGNCCWFVETSGNKVVQFDPSTDTFREWAIPTASSSTTSLATTTISGSIAIFGTEFTTNKVFLFFPNSGTFKEYTLPTADSGPEYISVEPPSAYVRAWFSEFGGPSNSYTRNSMGEIVYNVGSGVASLYEWTLPAAAGGGANGVLATAGDIWLAGVGAIVKWDRAAGQFTTWAIPAHPSTQAAFIDVDSLGQAWYTSRRLGASSTDNYVGVLRGDNTFKEWQIPTAGADPRVISLDPSQNPWIAEQGAGKVAQLDPSSGGTITPSAPATTAFAPVLGALTTTTTGGVAPSIANVAPTVNPNTGVTTGQFTEWALAASSHPHDVAVDASGNVWILESSINKVARLTISTPDFSLNASPGTLSIPQGGSATVTITGTSVLGYSGPVTLSITGSVPPDVTFSSFNPNPITIPSGGSTSATLTVNVASGASTGSSPITVSGTGGATHTTTFTLTITSGADFSLSLSSSSLSVSSGGSVTDIVTVTSIGPFNSLVDLTAESLPSGVHVGFSPSSVTPPAGGTITSTATISVDAGTPASTPTITITGTSGSLMHSQTLALTITLTPDFTLNADPASMTILQGTSGTSTITVGSTNAFSSVVTLTYSWIGTAPSEVSISLPGPITPPSGSTATSTLTVSAGSTSSTGSFTLSVTGASGSLTHSVNVGITINVASTTTASSTTTTPSAPTCLIATATYGSELAPEVQLLRNFRDNSILRTKAGSNFMVAFNAWYYSFSPYVAAYINTHLVERAVVKGVLYPMIGILFLTSGLFSATSAYPEIAALLSGLLASSLIGALYLGLPLSIVRTKIRRLAGSKTQRSLLKVLGAAFLIGAVGLLFGELFSYALLLTLTASTIVLSTLFASAVITSGVIAKRYSNLEK